MILKPLIAAMAIAIGISATTAMVATPARAQSNVEAEMLGFHQLCDKGDRKACVRFGILIGKNEQRHAGWRKSPNGSGGKDNPVNRRPPYLGGLLVLPAARLTELALQSGIACCRPLR